MGGRLRVGWATGKECAKVSRDPTLSQVWEKLLRWGVARTQSGQRLCRSAGQGRQVQSDW